MRGCELGTAWRAPAPAQQLEQYTSAPARLTAYHNRTYGAAGGMDWWLGKRWVEGEGQAGGGGSRVKGAGQNGGA